MSQRRELEICPVRSSLGVTIEGEINLSAIASSRQSPAWRGVSTNYCDGLGCQRLRIEALCLIAIFLGGTSML